MSLNYYTSNEKLTELIDEVNRRMRMHEEDLELRADGYQGQTPEEKEFGIEYTPEPEKQKISRSDLLDLEE